MTLTSLDFGGNRLAKEGDIVEALDHHFVTVGPKLADEIQQRINDDPLIHVAKESNTMKLNSVIDTFIFTLPFSNLE